MRKRRERRRHRRLKQRQRIYIQVLESDREPSLKGKTCYCSTLDISATGLQLEFDREAPPGCVLDLWVEVAGRPGRFFLTGEVRWCLYDEARGKYLLGIELMEETSTDVVGWMDLVSDNEGLHDS
ncbi:MAG: hypothetical protein Kow006_28960 [Gammaproteobacteria bacterium]